MRDLTFGRLGGLGDSGIAKRETFGTDDRNIAETKKPENALEIGFLVIIG